MAARISRFGFAEVALSGRCMEPLLVAGNRVRVAACPDPGVGDLCLVALPGGGLALHRVVAAVGGAVVCKGDFSGRAEEVPRGSVLGRAVAFRLAGSSSWREWAQDGACAHEVAALSLALCDRSLPHADRDAARRRIWEMNAAARSGMAGSCGPVIAGNARGWAKKEDL